MTVSASSSLEFTRGQILRRAMQKAGLLSAGQNPSDKSALVQQAADILDIELDALQADAEIINTRELVILQLAAGQSQYALPATTLDVIGSAALIQSAASGELPVEPMSADDWQRITTKTAAGVPRRYYLHRLLAVQLYLWPVPTSPDWTLRYRQVRFLRDSGDQTKTLDLARYWVKYIIAEVAHQLAVSNAIPTERCGYLRSDAERCKKSALGYNRPRGPTQMHSMHRGGFYR